MEITGKVIQLLPLQTGQGSKGEWRKQEFILETPGQYPKRVAMSLWGAELINKYDLETGMDVKAFINLESKEYNGRWYTEVRCWKIETDSRRSAPAPDTGITSNSGSGSDDLPF